MKALTDIKDYILKYNPYFQNGYDEVFTTVDGIVVADDQNQKTIFPSDNEGTYFYLRQMKSGTFDVGSPYRIANSIRGIGMQISIMLVAYMPDGDTDLLIQNLLNTLQAYPDTSLKFLNYNTNPYFVIQEELAGLEKENIAAALGNFKNNNALISFSFSLTVPVKFFEPSCIKIPCVGC